VAQEITGIYRKTLLDSDFSLTTTDVALVASKWVEVCSYTVPAQSEISVGVTESAQGGAQGRPAYIRFDHTDAAQITSMKIRVVVTDANDANAQVIIDATAAEWSADKTDRTKALLLPESLIRAQEDSKIKIEAYETDSSAHTVDVSDANTEIQLPVTIRTLRRG
jgi:hypothetical protein